MSDNLTEEEDKVFDLISSAIGPTGWIQDKVIIDHLRKGLERASKQLVSKGVKL